MNIESVREELEATIINIDSVLMGRKETPREELDEMVASFEKYLGGRDGFDDLIKDFLELRNETSAIALIGSLTKLSFKALSKGMVGFEDIKSYFKMADLDNLGDMVKDSKLFAAIKNILLSVHSKTKEGKSDE